MKLLPKVFVLLAACVLGLAIGVALRSRMAARVHSATPRTSVEKSFATQKSGVSNSTPALIDDSPLATQLERSLKISSGVTRWLLWVQTLEKAGPADFPRLARLARGDATAIRFLALRWLDLAPRHFFDTLLAEVRSGNSASIRELSDILFEQWPKRDPQGVIDALNEAGDFGLRDLWRHRVADSIFNTDVERGLRLMSEWHIENYGPSMRAISKWMAPDPMHAAQFTLDNAAGYAAQLTMETIGKEWAKTDPAAAMAFASAHPGQLGSTLGAAALKQWATTDFSQAADWLANTDSRTLNHLSPAFVEAWAKTDASAALAWCDENLSGSSLAQSVRSVVTGAADKNLTAAAALVAQMEPSPARTEAAIAVAHKWMPGLSSDKSVPPEAVAWLGGLDAECCKRVLGEIDWQWATSDPKTMAGFLGQSGGDRVPSSADTILARQMARENPLQALDWASQLPQARGLDAGAAAYAEWRNSQPDAATEWFNALAADDPRRQPFFKSAVETMAWGSQAAAQLAAMSDSERVAAKNIIQGLTLPDDKRERLLEALGK
jgi:hypothetical protein